MLTHRRSTAAAALAVIALTAPNAAARPAYDGLAETTAHRPSAPTRIVAHSPGRGFEWGSTVVGAGGATILCALAGVGALTLTRRRHSKTQLAP